MNKLRISRKLITAAACTVQPAGLGYRAGVPQRRSRPRTVCLLAVAVAWLAALGVPGVSQSAALASSPGLTWTQQHPAASPPARWDAAMAYDAATGDIVLFGGHGKHNVTLGDTWTWDGSTWTKQHPATGPPARQGAAMAYDAATSDIVLFGGYNGNSHGHTFGDTWTWDGSTWTKQHPATSPLGRAGASIAYDAATSNVVLFGGFLLGTWTWDGSTWTKQQPAISPPLRGYASMAYDAATSDVVLFGGNKRTEVRLGDTWTWDGSVWTKQHPATSPPARTGAAMAYDAATSDIVLFGGLGTHGTLSGTWSWDGSAWTQQHPATSPPRRYYAAMAYDAATSDIVLFGGLGTHGTLGDTWTWGGPS
jgi:hypothetical protein